MDLVFYKKMHVNIFTQRKRCPKMLREVRYYRKRGSASFIVREVHSVRERESETEVTSR